MKRTLFTVSIVAAVVFSAVLSCGGADDTAAFVRSNIQWLGHDTFRIEGGKIIYTDPFKIKKADKADIILITHDHFDHCSGADVKKLLGPKTVVVTPGGGCKGFKADERIVKPGDRLEVEGIAIEVVPSYNVNKDFHPKDKGYAGYIITVKGKRIYHAGDTDLIPEMKTFKNIDIALLPVSGTYVMTADEARAAALEIKPRIAIPMHYGDIVGTRSDAERFAEGLKGKVEVIILEKQ